MVAPGPHGVSGGGRPVLILGGFLITPEAYEPMRASLEARGTGPVRVVPVGKAEWLLTVFPFAWARILDRVAAMARELAAASADGRITLVGHSSGGIMLRLFLDGQPFQGRRYDGRAWAHTLVMLGSPHTALKATALRRLVERRLPGAYFDAAHPERHGGHPVRYVSVAGDLDLADAAAGATDLARRLAPPAYRNSTGNPNDRGDGLVPVTSALLEGSEAVVLPGVAHGGAFGATWYGTPAVVEDWWHRVDGCDPHPGSSRPVR